jgi:osomolarity two-component system, response regulator SKN7
VVLAVLAGHRPPRPSGSEKVGLTEYVWNLIERGWRGCASDRPPLATFLDAFLPPGSHSAPVTPGNNLTNITAVHAAFRMNWATPPSVLLVDDDTVIRNFAKRSLQLFGCSIDIATDGIAGIDRMSHAQYDLVLMDIAMPGTDGAEATRIIRQTDTQTPIIAMASAIRPQDLIRYFGSGMSDILPKPFSKEALYAMIEV